jgi:hypothetical protein
MARQLEFKKGRTLDWDAEIERLNRTASGQRRIVMGSDGSAQVTRVRLLSRYANLRARTEGPVLVLELPQ